MRSGWDRREVVSPEVPGSVDHGVDVVGRVGLYPAVGGGPIEDVDFDNVIVEMDPCIPECT